MVWKPLRSNSHFCTISFSLPTSPFPVLFHFQGWHQAQNQAWDFPLASPQEKVSYVEGKNIQWLHLWKKKKGLKGKTSPFSAGVMLSHQGGGLVRNRKCSVTDLVENMFSSNLKLKKTLGYKRRKQMKTTVKNKTILSTPCKFMTFEDRCVHTNVHLPKFTELCTLDPSVLKHLLSLSPLSIVKQLYNLVH